MTAQAESPFYAPEVLRGLFGAVRPTYAHVHGYLAGIPTYPGGLWTFLFASNERRPEDVSHDRASALDTRYFGPGVARGAFELPRFVADLVG